VLRVLSVEVVAGESSYPLCTYDHSDTATSYVYSAVSSAGCRARLPASALVSRQLFFARVRRFGAVLVASFAFVSACASL
jgi:hypothetical protein